MLTKLLTMLMADTCRDARSEPNVLLVAMTAKLISKYHIDYLNYISDVAVLTGGKANANVLLLFRNENDTINWNETSVDDVVAYVTRLRSQLRVALLTANPDESQNQHVKQMFA